MRVTEQQTLHAQKGANVGAVPQQSLRGMNKILEIALDGVGGADKEIGVIVQEDTSEFLNGLQTAVEHIMLHQAGSPAKLDSRSKVPLSLLLVNTLSCTTIMHPTYLWTRSLTTDMHMCAMQQCTRQQWPAHARKWRQV